MIYSKKEAFRDTSHHQVNVKYHEKLRYWNKSYFNKIYI